MNQEDETNICGNESFLNVHPSKQEFKPNGKKIDFKKDKS